MCSNFEPIKLDRAHWVEQQLKTRLPQAEWKPHVHKFHLAPFVYLENGIMRCELGHFGIIPPWVDPNERKKLNTYNARTETVDSKKSYRPSWLERKFGIVLAERFYEPLYDESGKRSKPTAIYRSDGQPTAIATIWESFEDEDTGKTMRSFSMLTVNADTHPLMSKFHSPEDEKRSVVVIENEYLEDWLTATHSDAANLLKLSPDGYLTADLSKPISPQLSIFD